MYTSIYEFFLKNIDPLDFVLPSFEVSSSQKIK